jgi:GH24 family phage-related lysozyme (muramidase)
MNIDQYKREERKQTIHRSFNTILSVVILVFGFFFIKAQLTPVYESIAGITEQRVERKEISTIFTDESLRLCQYNDSLGNATIGVGHLVLKSDNMPRCITTKEAITLLQKDYQYAKSNVEKRYPWADGDTKRILINMSFQLGESRLSKFKETLKYLEAKKYYLAAGEVLDSNLYKQTPRRLERHVSRILSLGD